VSWWSISAARRPLSLNGRLEAILFLPFFFLLQECHSHPRNRKKRGDKNWSLMSFVMPGVGSSKPPSYHQLRRSLCRSIHQQIIRTSLPDFFPQSSSSFFSFLVRRLIINMGERRVDTSTSFGTSTLFPMASFTYNDGALFIYVVWSDLRRSTHGSRANAYRNFFLCKATDIVSFLLAAFDRFDESSCMYVSSFGYDRKGRER